MNINLIKEISLLIGIWIAIYGIDSWRREYIGKRQMELAEKVLSLFYEARDIIKYIRNPLSFIGEGSSRKKSEKESETKTEVLNRAHIIFERYDKHSELFNKLRTYRYQMMALKGEKASEPFDLLNQCLNEIFTSSRNLARYWLRQATNTQQNGHYEEFLKKMHKAEDVFWDSMDNNDPINLKVDNVIKKAEELCVPTKNTLFSFLNYKIFGK